MRRPSFQFYPADWLGNPNLRRCTHAEKGMWIDILCLLHDGDQYGVLRWTLKEIADAIGATKSAVYGLVKKGVLKGGDDECESLIYTPRSGRKNGEPVALIDDLSGPIWYSSRMVIDEHKAMVREKNITNAQQKTAPKERNGETNGQTNGANSCDHPPRAITPAAPSSSSSSSASPDIKETPIGVSKKQPRGTRCPWGDQSEIPADLMAEAENYVKSRGLIGTVFPEREALKSINWAHTQTGAKGIKINWDRFLVNWIIEACDRIENNGRRHR